MAFNEKKIAEMAAYFLHKRGGQMSHLKLMKLLYLAERKSICLYGTSMSGDKLVSMPHGPVLSMTLDLMGGNTKSQVNDWEHLISDKENHELSLTQSISIDDLDELSAADLEILDDIWSEFGSMDRWQIREYTHQHCKEWRDPKGSSYPISYKKLFQVEGRSDCDANAMAGDIEEQDYIDDLFATL